MVLGDHIRKGKHLVPPAIAAGLPLQETTWHMERLPDLFWLGFIAGRVGRRSASDLAQDMAYGIEATINRVRGDKKAVRAYIISEHLGFTAEERDQIIADHEQSAWLKALSPHLKAQASIWPEFPARYLVNKGKSNTKAAVSSLIEEIRSLLGQCMYRHDSLSLSMQAIALMTEMRSGHLYINEGLSIPDLNAVFDYPNTEESKHAAGFIVASCNAMIMGRNGPFTASDYAWPRHFWNSCYHLQPCEHE
jgi:hypothetical protein